jgi:hypothetical protein
MRSKRVGFAITDLKRITTPHFDVYFHLWRNGGENWVHEWKKCNEEDVSLRAATPHYSPPQSPTHSIAMANFAVDPKPFPPPVAIIEDGVLLRRARRVVYIVSRSSSSCMPSVGTLWWKPNNISGSLLYTLMLLVYFQAQECLPA